MFLKKQRWPINIYFLILGAVLIVGAGYHAWKTIDFYFIKESAETEATIVEIEIIEKPRADAHKVYVSFKLDNGELHTSLLDTYVEGMEINDTIKIIYDKNNPDEIILWWSSPLLIVFFGGLGMLIIMITLINRRVKKKRVVQ